MEQDEFEDIEVCASCGVPVYADSEGVFGFGTENLLCAQCALSRGGRYDVERDIWDVEPDLSGLRDEAYGASPHEVRRRRE